jgi:hypothetical protein
MVAQLVGEGRQNADQLALVGIFEVLDVIVEFKNGFRLDEHRLPRGRLIVDQALYPALVLGNDGQYQAAPANRRLSVAGNPALRLGVAQDAGNLLAQLHLAANELLLELGQERGSVVAHQPFVVHHLVQGGQQVAVHLHADAQQAQRGIQAFLGLGEEGQRLADGAQAHLHGEEGRYVEVGPGQGGAHQVGVYVVVVLTGEVGTAVEQQAELVGLLEQLQQLVVLGLEAHLSHELAAQGAQAQAFQHLTQLREAYFLLEVLGENQIRYCVIGRNRKTL